MAVAAVTAALPAIQQAGGAVFEQMQAFRKYSAVVMARESTAYDAEKVFIQSIYGVGLFVVMKVAFETYWTLKYADFCARHPVEGLLGILPQIVIFSPVLILIDALDPDLLDETSKEALEEWNKEVAADPLHHVKPIFEDYWMFALFGIVGGSALLEKRRVDRLKRKAKLMMKAFE